MPPPLLTKLDNRFPIAHHEHVAVLYSGGENAFRFASFLSEGLKDGDLCYYVAPEDFQQGMLGKLRGVEINPESCVRSGQLCLEAGTAESAALKSWLPRAFARAERIRAPALRWLEEGSWAESAGLPLPKYFEFHALLNYQVKHYPSVALCQYALDRLEPRQLCSAIAVHRHLIIENTFVRDNPFYIPPEKYLALTLEERERGLAEIFRGVGFDVAKLLDTLTGYGKL
jgi:MEDS: MEthanogen/methylotroph, DcmR Sensory domain